MTTNTPSNHAAKSRAAAQVVAWKLEIKSFFDDDWSRLRTLILDLEEQSWDDSSPAALHCGNGNWQNSIPSQGSSDHSGNALNHNDASPDPKPVVKDRLAELAEQIERRLQTARANGK